MKRGRNNTSFISDTACYENTEAELAKT